jgi:hypothetical protein
VNRNEARNVLLELARVSNDGGSFEELWAIQAAQSPSRSNMSRQNMNY